MKKISSSELAPLFLIFLFFPSLLFSQGSPPAAPGGPEPPGWYTGDIHVHRNCGEGTAVSNVDQMAAMMKVNRLSVISLLADIGNGEVKFAPADMPNVNGGDDSLSLPDRIIHWDAEWHWDATYSNFSHQALGGHLVLLGLKEAHQIWDESPYKVLKWARSQEAVTGFAHFEYLKDTFQQDLNCCIPVEYPVEAALGTIDFVSEDVFGVRSPNNGNYNSEAAIHAWYKLLNCGFRISLAAGTDFPCNNLEPLGTLLTYVNVGSKPLTYDRWIRGLKAGRTIVTRDGHNEFLDLRIDKIFQPGDDLGLAKGRRVNCSVTWTSAVPLTGTIELLCNGVVVATHPGSVAAGKPVVFSFRQPVSASSWICARRMSDSGHAVQTGAVYVTVAKKPVRASAADARYFMNWIDTVLTNTAASGPWSRYFTHDQETVYARYKKARDIFQTIYNESEHK